MQYFIEQDTIAMLDEMLDQFNSRRLREIWFTQEPYVEPQFPAFLKLYRGWDLVI